MHLALAWISAIAALRTSSPIDILDLSRIEAGRIELNVEYFDLADSLAEVLSVINRWLAQRIWVQFDRVCGQTLVRNNISLDEVLRGRH